MAVKLSACKIVLRTKYWWLVSLLLLLHSPLMAAIQDETIYSTESQQAIDLIDLAQQIRPGSVVIVSEYHDNEKHHAHQIRFLHTLRKALHHSHGISVGMEFFYYPDQPLVDDYLLGRLGEKDFLLSVNWSGFPFDFYRQQVLFPLSAGGWTQALNAPRWLTSKVAREGLDSLTPTEGQSLPPNFAEGDALYYDRFAETMGGGHIPQAALKRYFAAQSIWDDTMAWRALSYLQGNPHDVLVIMVGDFHAIYGGGLPARLRARGANQVITVGQVDLADYSAQEREDLLTPHPRWGVRADYIWTSHSREKRNPGLYWRRVLHNRLFSSPTQLLL